MGQQFVQQRRRIGPMIGMGRLNQGDRPTNRRAVTGKYTGS